MMKLLWKTDLPSLANTWTAPFQGALVSRDACLKYYFFSPSGAGVSGVTFDVHSGEVLACDKNTNNGLRNKERYATRKPPRHYSEDDFVFGEYRIAHQGGWGYVCTRNNEFLWKKSLRGYLYTDMIKIGDRIVFGTAGMGGHFYALDINSGDIVFDFNTKGTCAFVQTNDSIYFAMSKKKSTDIYRIDDDGNILESLELDGIRDDYDCPMALWDESIYVVTMRREKDGKWEKFTPVLNRIEL